MSREKNNLGNKFSARLRRAMDLHNLTQSQMADAAGVTQATVYKWLHGAVPGGAELNAAAKALAVPMEWLLGADSEDTEEALRELDPKCGECKRLERELADLRRKLRQLGSRS